MNNIRDLFFENKRILIERNISASIISQLEEEKIISYKDDFVLFVMKDLQGNILGNKIRRRMTDALKKAKKKKSWNEKGSHPGLFYRAIDYSRPILLVEGEVDRCTALQYYDNVIGLSTINILDSTILSLQEVEKECDIYLLVDNDDVTDENIDKVINDSSIEKEFVYDARKIFGGYKDINEYHMDGNLLDVDNIRNNFPSLQEVLNKRCDYLVWDDKGNFVEFDCKRFTEYLFRKEGLAYASGMIFKCNKETKIWHIIGKDDVGKVITKNIDHDLRRIHKENIVVKKKRYDDIFGFFSNISIHEGLCNRLYNRNYNNICLRDKILNLKDFSLKDLRRQDYQTNQLNFSSELLSQENVEPVMFLGFLNSVLSGYSEEGKKKIISFLQEYIGYLFLPSTKFEKAVLLYGSGGNGKGTFCQTVASVLTKQNYSELGLNQLNDDKYINLLGGKLVNIDFEMDKKTHLDSSVIKKIISGETVTGRPVYKSPVEVPPMIRLLVASNTLPKLDEIDASIYRRRIFIELRQSYIGKEDFCLKKNLEAEIDKIFVRAIAGLKRLLARGKFEKIDELEANIKQFIYDEDVIQQFIDEYFKVSPNNWLSNTEIYDKYKEFCKEKTHKTKSDNTFFKEFKKKNVVPETKNNKRGYCGLDYLDFYER